MMISTLSQITLAATSGLPGYGGEPRNGVANGPADMWLTPVCATEPTRAHGKPRAGAAPASAAAPFATAAAVRHGSVALGPPG